MAGQGLFCKTFNILGNGRFLLNRFTNLNIVPVANLKQETKDLIEKLNIPEKPKKPLSPYIKFASDHRPSVVKTHPDWKNTEIIKKCAEDWRNAHATIREKYMQEYKNESETYQHKLVKYSASLTDDMREAIAKAQKEKKEVKEKRKVKKLYKETGKPKRPLTAFSLYLMDQCKIKNQPLKEILKDIKGAWMNLSEEEKQKYQNLYTKEKEKYEKELRNWEKKMVESGHEDLIRNRSKGKRTSRLQKEKTE